MNNYRVFEVGDIIRLRDDLRMGDFLNLPKRITRHMLPQLMSIWEHLFKEENTLLFDNTYVQVLEIIDNSYLRIRIVESDKRCLVNKCLLIHSKFIDKEVLRMLFIERNSKKTIRRHDNKIKNSKFGKSKFFHKDKY